MDNFEITVLTVVVGWFWMIVGFTRLLQEE